MFLEEVALTGIEKTSRRFFVRVPAEKEAEALRIFGGVSVIEAQVPGEVGFITNPMTEAEFNEKAEKAGIISRIRVE